MSKKERFLIILFASLAIGLATTYFFVAVGCDVFDYYSKDKIKKNSVIEAKLLACEEEQSKVNIPVMPKCYFEVFTEHGLTAPEVKAYLQVSKNINIDKNLTNKFWIEAWEDFNKKE